MKYLLVLLFALFSTLSFANLCLDSNKCKNKFFVGENFLSIYSNYKLNQIPKEITKAIIVVHGTGRNGNDYFDNFIKAAKAHNHHANTLIIAPSFKRSDDDKESDEMYWGRRWYQKWKFGYISHDSTQISSFAVIDKMILALKKRGIKKVQITGHSAGGQFTQRYATGTKIDREINIEFIPSNPSSYMYLHPERVKFTQGNFEVFNNISDCEEYNHYIYGVEDRARYLDRMSVSDLRENFSKKKIKYLMAEKDIGLANLDKSCEAYQQGLNRFERSVNFYHYVKKFFPNNNHRFYSIPGVGHDNYLVYSSAQAGQIFFNQKATSFLTRKIGSPTDIVVNTNPVYLYLGGGKNEFIGFKEFLSSVNGGDIVVITGKDYLNHRYTHDLWRMSLESKIDINSIRVFSITSTELANNAEILKHVSNAEGIFFTGGDQSRYIKFLKNSKLLKIINQNQPSIAGTSAGLAIMGEYIFSAKKGGISSRTALRNPFDSYITIAESILNIEASSNLITDTHFSERNREGRLLSFMYRSQYDYKLNKIYGLGIDEQTSVLVKGKSVSVHGEGASYLYMANKNLISNQRDGLNYKVNKLRLLKGNTYPLFHEIDMRKSENLTITDGRLEREL